MSAQGAQYKTLLVTGSAGFLGQHLLAHLCGAPGAPRQVVGVDCRAKEAPGGSNQETCDLTDQVGVRGLMERLRPDGVVHLAGLTRDDDPDAIFAVNVGICQNLISAASAMASPPRVLVVGSAAQYGITCGDAELVGESHPLLGRTLYGVSKTMQEIWALTCGAGRGVPVVCVRPFNILGPGQPESLVPAAFLHQAADVLAGRTREIRVGNTETRRDFTDVRDVVAAMWALMCAGPAADGQVFNIASGQATAIQDMLDAAIALAGRDIPVVRDSARTKAADVPTIVGDATKLRSLTGWQCRIPWARSMEGIWERLRPSQAEQR